MNLPTVKIAYILDQKCSDEVTYVPHEEQNKMLKRYKDIVGRKPHPDVACTPEQLTALAHVVATHRPPFADFGVWGPHGVRIQKKNSMKGLLMTRDGSFIEAELFGPPSYGQWEECFDVLATGLLMLDIVSRNKIADYKDHIRELAAAYGPKVWHLLYQTDVRCRQEYMHELHQDASMAHVEAVEQAAHSSFQPKRPWDTVFSMAISEGSSKWWTREFERPAQLVLTHIASLDSMLGGDVGLSSSRLLGTAPPHVAQRRPEPPPRAQPGQQRGQQKVKAVKQRSQMHASPDGSLGTNMKGKPLCGGFQNGHCQQVLPNSFVCAATGKMHQCSRCLSGDHGSNFPQACTKDQKAVKTLMKNSHHQNGKGKGKGKGKW
ncbi:MAG: hypothetical protein OSB57_14335 [Planctomycetota bacterium]|nr:hypothetical protein [Planctomycetota bacterium]